MFSQIWMDERELCVWTGDFERGAEERTSEWN